MPRGGFLGAYSDRPLFGRHPEVARLAKALDEVQTGHGRVLALAGEPGVGKTRLAQEASVLADERGFLVLVGRCYEERASLPLLPFIDALAAGLALAPEALRRQVPRRWPELGPLLSSRPGSVSPASPLGQSEDARLHLFASLSEFVRELATDAPVALLLDDMHWADSASLGLLVYLARDLAAYPVLLLMTYRDIEVGDHPALRAAVRDLTRERLLDTLSIHGLELEDTAEMVRAHLHQESVPDAFVSLVHRRTVGNAFFIEEMLRALAEQRRPSSSSNTWFSDTGDQSLPLPDSVRAVVEQRVERLGTTARDVLRLASVFGQQFDLPILLSAIDAPEDAVLSDLDAAVKAQLIQEQQTAHGGRYGFIHALVQQTLYEQQPLQRRGLHARVAKAIERVRGKRVDAAAELAWHFLASGDTERATRYSIVAGDHSASLYAHVEAAEHYQRAIDLLLDGDDEQRLATLRCKLGAELNYISRREEALIAYEGALLAFERSHDTTGQATAHHGMAAVEHGRWDFPAELPHLEAALRLTPDEGTPERAWLLLDAVRVRCIVADYAAAVPLAARAMSIVEQLDDARLQARALTESAHVEMYHSPRVALELLARAEPLAHQAGDWRTLGRIHWSAGHRWQEAGDWQRSRLSHQAAMAAFERAGEPERVVFCLRLQASECIQLGAWEDGRSAARRAAETDPDWQFQSLPGPAFLNWMEGRPEQALDDLHTYIAISRQRNDFQSLPTGLYMLADCALQLDRIDVALAAANEAFELVREHGFWPYAVLVGAPLAEALVRSKVEDVEHQLEAIEGLVAEHDQRGGDAQFLRARGMLQRQCGELESAIQSLQRSAAVAREQSAVVQCGRTLAVLTDMAAAAGDRQLASASAAGLADITRRIGPEVAALTWAAPVLDLAAPSLRQRYPDGLTQREVEVLRLISTGHSNAEIAEQLVMSVRTVERHITNLYTKIGARNRADATAHAIRHQLV